MTINNLEGEECSGATVLLAQPPRKVWFVSLWQSTLTKVLHEFKFLFRSNSRQGLFISTQQAVCAEDRPLFVAQSIRVGLGEHALRNRLGGQPGEAARVTFLEKSHKNSIGISPDNEADK